MTLDTIKSTFDYMDGHDSACYFGTHHFPGYGNSCDLYFRTKDRAVIQSQLDAFNDFKLTYEKHIREINLYIGKSLTPREFKKAEEIEKAVLHLEVLEIPQENPNYDLVLICSKTYKKFLGKKYIAVRVEFQAGRIKSVLRTTNTMKDNE